MTAMVWNTAGKARRWLAAGMLGAALAGCTVIPESAEPVGQMPPVATTPAPTPTEQPDALPQDEERQRIALLVPLTGPNADVGQAIANATTMALLDTNAANLRITTYDTASQPGGAAARAITDGNRLILGPLLAENINQVVAQARPAGVPLLAFSNDVTKASRDVFLLGLRPAQTVDRVVRHARANGANRFAALIPDGEYGRRAELALMQTLDEAGGRLVAVERYDRGNTSIVSAAGRLAAGEAYDAVLVADSARLVATAAPTLKTSGNVRILGTELWSGDMVAARSPALRGAWFAAFSDDRYRQFYDSYRTRFGEAPPRIATLGYDAVLLTLNVARDWQSGQPFPVGELDQDGGFLGIDGAFRFNRIGIGERVVEVREVRDGSVAVVSEAPAGF